MTDDEKIPMDSALDNGHTYFDIGMDHTTTTTKIYTRDSPKTGREDVPRLLRERRTTKKSWNFPTEDILAVGAAVAAVVLAIGIVARTLDATAGGAIIGGLVGAASIAQVIKSKKKSKK